MTHTPNTPSVEDAPLQTPKVYASPALTALGTIDAVTAGPRNRGAIDQIIGTSGGFQDDGTS